MSSDNGGYTVRNGVVYVFGVVDGDRKRLSTKKKATKNYVNWVSKNHRKVLLQLIDEKKASKSKLNSKEFQKFCHDALALTAHKRDESTQKDYLSKIDRLIVPHFKSIPIQDIKAYNIELWQNNLLLEYSTTTVKRVRNIFSMILDKAVANDIIAKNPIDLADNIQVEHEQTEIYTLEEMTLILQNSEGWLRVFLFVAFATGMRPGELIALQWDDIDYERKAIFLQRSISHGVIKTKTRTKNHYRIVFPPNLVLDMLKEHQKKSKNEWVFPSRLGTPYHESKGIGEKHFKPFLEKIGVPYKTLKAARNTYVSLLRNDGVSSDIVTEIAGHSKEVSDKHYYQPEVSDAKINAVNNVFDKIDVFRDKRGHN